LSYRIEPEVLVRAVTEVLDRPLENGDRFAALTDKLSRIYPDLIDRGQRRWLASRAGGILGKLTFLHVGFSEYLLIFGTPAGTQGFSGRYSFMEVYKVILAGQIATYDLESNQIAPTVYRPGDLGYMQKGEARGLDIAAGTWHLEYGRGPNLTAMPFGMMDTVFSSLELKTVGVTAREYTSFILKGLRRSLTQSRG
jgi:hypothetical protein